ncbi:MAG: MerR family transcriptional regulator [Candidatus Omnitrophica bacterium]|nr:MerR family transcriptional regulator [Candidatus Omnitrophota bacterium]
MSQEKFYNTKEVLKKTKISRNTLFLWLKKGKISEVLRDRNGYRLFSERDIISINNYKNKKFFPVKKKGHS